MSLVKVVWYDGFRRVREQCTLLNETDDTLTFKDCEGVEFTITRAQLVKMS